MGIWKDLVGTLLTTFRIGLTGNTLETSAGRIRIRDAANAAYAAIAALRADISGDTVVLNSEGANTYILRRPTSQSAPLSFELPPTAGSAGQVLSTNGSGVTTWISAGGVADRVGCDTTTLAFGDTSPKAMFTLPANAVVSCVRVTVDTSFTGTPTLSVGTSGAPSKYLASTQVDLKQPAATQFETYPALPSVGTPETLQITYSAGSATAGSARVELFYCNPN